MVRYIIIILIFLTTVSFAQFQRRQKFDEQIGTRGIYFESVVVPADSGAVCFIPFRIAYNQVVFTKNNEKYNAKFSVNLEAVDSISQKIYRDIITKNLVVDDYKKTVDPNLFCQGLLKLDIPSGKYKIRPLIFDYNASKEHFVRSFYVQVNGIPDIHNPVIFHYEKTSCGDSSLVLANYQGQIPFSEENFGLLIPVEDTSITTINVEILDQDSIIYKKEIDESSISDLNLIQCENNILVNLVNKKHPTRNFYLKDFTGVLAEGRITIQISSEKSDKKNNFPFFIQWVDKPLSLFNLDYAIKILKFIATEEEIKELNKVTDQKQYPALVDYWKKFDPTPETKYNELMNEYYERVDYSMKNFSIIGSREGAETDRGRIYIQFGKPENIHRIYNDSRNIKEIWSYSNPERQFIFVDKTGLGNFVLNENL